jgi:hypothetical protein
MNNQPEQMKCFCDNEIITRPSFIHGNICLDCLQDLFVVCICDFNKKKFNHFTYECLEDPEGPESPEGSESPENPEPEGSGISKHHVYINDLEELVQYKLANKVQDIYIVNTCRGCQTVDESVLEYYKEPEPEQQKEPEPEITLSDEDLNIIPKQDQDQDQEQNQDHFQEDSQVMEYHREEDRMRNESDENTEEYPEETPEPENNPEPEPECEETPEQIEERNRLIQERFTKYQEQMTQILKEQEQIAEKMKKEAINHIRLSRENCSQVYLKITSDSENPVEIDSLIFEEHFVSYCKKSKREPII